LTPSAGRRSHQNYRSAAVRWLNSRARERAEIGGDPDTIGDSWGQAMLLNVGLWLILAAIIALIPLGCILTRTKSKGPPQAGQ
jgi:hypothetical protein